MSRVPDNSRNIVRMREKFHCFRCTGSASEGQWHHRRRRAVRDDWTHHWTNGLWLCGTCHLHVHKNPLESRRTGYIVSSYCTNPSQVPIMRIDGTWVLLTLDGNYVAIIRPENGETDEAEAKVVPLNVRDGLDGSVGQ